jgi:hypothetical protein
LILIYHKGSPAVQNAASENIMNLDNYNYGFGSNAANLEYSILSNMLGSPITTDPSRQSQQQQQINSADVLGNIWPHQQSPIIDSVASTPMGMIRAGDTSFLASPTQLVNTPTSNYISNATNSNNNVNSMNTTTGTSSNNKHVTSIASSTMDTSQISASGVSTLSAYGDGAVVANVASPVTASTGPSIRRRNQIITPEMAYASATKPFSYADGYHYLINYVKTR